MKKMFAAILALSLFSSAQSSECMPRTRVFASAESGGFVYEDMDGHWAEEAAIRLVEYDVIKGERIGKRYYFYPDTKIRRLEAAEYILSALKADFDKADKNETYIFADCKALPEYVNKTGFLANKLGFFEGIREGELVYFHPYENITRAEFIKMLDLAIKPKSSDENAFADKGNIPNWAVQSVKNLVGCGILNGFENDTLRPNENITKAEAAELIYRMLKYNEENYTEALSERISRGLFGNYIV